MVDHELQTALDEHLAKLAAIGTADQLAVHFESQGMQAMCGNAQQCAIAQSITDALSGHLLHGAVIWVECKRVTFSISTHSVYLAKADLSPEVQQFITDFDEHRFPALVAH